MMVAAAFAAVVGALNSTHRFGADHPIAILLIVLPGMAALAVALHPMAALAGDRLSGRLALERALPLPWHSIAGARLIGAAVRTLSTPLILLAALVGVMRHTDFAPSLPVGLAIIAAIWMISTMACWILMAANARWSLVRLWWVPTTIWFAPQWLPAAWVSRAMEAIRPVGEWIAGEAGGGRGPVYLLPALAVVMVATGVGATALYASGLRRYVHDPDPLGLVGKRDRVNAALEYPPGRRPALAALALLDIRLGVELLARRWIILAILVVVTLVGPDEVRGLAPLYIRILGVMVPGAVVAGILTGRQSGTIALLQYLPHPRWKVAAGKLAAVAVLSALGAAVIIAARLLENPAAMPSGYEFARLTGLTAGSIWLVTVVAMWWRRRYLYWLVPTLLAAVGAKVLLPAGFDPVIGWVVDVVRSPIASLLAFALVALMGIPVFAHGLARYQKS